MNESRRSGLVSAGPLPEAPWLHADALAVAALILGSHSRAWGRPLLAGCSADRTLLQTAQELFIAAEVVIAHDSSADPRLIYANRAALRLWRRPWQAMVGMPSRLTAEPEERASRAATLDLALRSEAIEGYDGIRVDSGGRRFHIRNARLWTLRDDQTRIVGQAAAFENWWWI